MKRLKIIANSFSYSFNKSGNSASSVQRSTAASRELPICFVALIASNSIATSVLTLIIYGKLKEEIGAILRRLSEYKSVEMIEGKACVDHIHVCL